jgi:UDP-N-acetylmuramate dehydrogenase
MLDIYHDYPLLLLNTFGIQAQAKTCVFIESPQQLQESITVFAGQHKLILGGGSNVVLTQSIESVLLVNRIKGISITAEDDEWIWLTCGGGEIWHDTVMYTINNGWGGLENLSLIPGTVGAAPIQNIGAYGAELKDSFVELTAVNLASGETIVFTHSDCKFGYRESIFKHEAKGKFFIQSVTFKLAKKPIIKTQYGDIQQTLLDWGISNPGVADVSKAVIHIRQSKLPNPAEIGNCGSFFKNPVISQEHFNFLLLSYPSIKSYDAGPGKVKVPAGWLIETAGWKGFREGDYGVHEKQALVLVNYGSATGSNIIALAKRIQADVLHKFQIPLEMEVNAW